MVFRASGTMLTNACVACECPVTGNRKPRTWSSSGGGVEQQCCRHSRMATSELSSRFAMPVHRSGLIAALVLILVLGQCHDIEALKITKLAMPSPIVNGTQPAIIIDCDYKYDQQDKRGLVIKWFFNNSVWPIYQWIPPHKPEAQGLFKERLDLEHKTAADPYTIHRSLRIVRPTLEMAGTYRCQVSSFQNEDEAEGELIVYAPATEVEINFTKPTPRNVNVTCTAAGIFPVPDAYLLVYRDGSEAPEIVKDVRLAVIYHEEEDDDEDSGDNDDRDDDGGSSNGGAGAERAVGEETKTHGHRGRKVATGAHSSNDDGNSVVGGAVAGSKGAVGADAGAANGLVGSYEATLYGLIEDRRLARETQFECLFKIEKAGYEKRTDRVPYYPGPQVTTAHPSSTHLVLPEIISTESSLIDMQNAEDSGVATRSGALCGLTVVVCLTISRFLVRL